MKDPTRKWRKFVIKEPQKVKDPDFEYQDETAKIEAALLANSRDRIATEVEIVGGHEE